MKKSRLTEPGDTIIKRKKLPYRRPHAGRSMWNRYLNIDDWPEELEDLDLINDSKHHGETLC